MDRGEEAFLEAVRQDDAVAVRAALARRPNLAGMPLADGSSPVTLAAKLGCNEALAALLAGGVAGRTPEADPQGGGPPTALMLAAGRGDATAVSLLLEHGADPALQDAEGRTAADWAHAAGHSDLAARLEPGTEAERSVWSGAPTDDAPAAQARTAEAPRRDPGR